MSNDKVLRKACESVGISVVWGLELMLQLVQQGQLPSVDASDAAERIHLANPGFVTSAILDAFRTKLAG